MSFIDPCLTEFDAFIAKSLRSETPSMPATAKFITATPKREIAFIDRGVDDLATLLASLRPDVEPILLSNDEPAPRQMARADVGGCGAGALSLETIDERKDEVAAFGLGDRR
jgi:hypothetical protein